MFTIGAFARLGLVSVRMLRHYDAVGLLRPPAPTRRPGTASTKPTSWRRSTASSRSRISASPWSRIQPLYQELMGLFEAAGTTPVGPNIAYYEDSPDGIVVHAAVPVNAAPGGGHPFAVVDLPAVEAATAIHRGPMDNVLGTLDALARWIEENGYRTVGLHREVYLDTTAADQSDW